MFKNQNSSDLAKLNLDEVAHKFPGFHQSFEFFMDDFFERWRERYTLDEKKTMFFFWFAGVVAANAVYVGVRAEFGKKERKTFMTHYNNELQGLIDYMDECLDVEQNKSPETLSGSLDYKSSKK